MYIKSIALIILKKIRTKFLNLKKNKTKFIVLKSLFEFSKIFRIEIIARRFLIFDKSLMNNYKIQLKKLVNKLLSKYLLVLTKIKHLKILTLNRKPIIPQSQSDFVVQKLVIKHSFFYTLKQYFSNQEHSPYYRIIVAIKNRTRNERMTKIERVTKNVHDNFNLVFFIVVLYLFIVFWLVYDYCFDNLFCYANVFFYCTARCTFLVRFIFALITRQ